MCIKTTCCPCLVLGDLNVKTEVCPCGFFGGCCLGSMCSPCFMAVAGPKVKDDENALQAFCCAYCCGCCYVMQVYREVLIKEEGGAPAQMEMK